MNVAQSTIEPVELSACSFQRSPLLVVEAFLLPAFRRWSGTMCPVDFSTIVSPTASASVYQPTQEAMAARPPQ